MYDENPEKKRRIHMNAEECLKYAQSAAGTLPLTDPRPMCSSYVPVCGPDSRLHSSRLNSRSKMVSSNRLGGVGFSTAAEVYSSQKSFSLAKNGSNQENDFHLHVLETDGQDERVLESDNALIDKDILSQRHKPPLDGLNCSLGSQDFNGFGEISREEYDHYEGIFSEMVKLKSPIRDPMRRVNKRRKPCTPQKNTMLNYVSVHKVSCKRKVDLLGNEISDTEPLTSSQESESLLKSLVLNDNDSCSSASQPSLDGLVTFQSSLSRCKVAPAKDHDALSSNCQAQLEKMVERKEEEPGTNVSNPAASNDDVTSSNSLFQGHEGTILKDRTTLDVYGLLGLKAEEIILTDEAEEDATNFSLLPPVIVENILCRLPLSDLLLNLTRVCQSWDEIISAENFIPWKKKYHMLKAGVESVVMEIQNVVSAAGMTSLKTCLSNLIIHMVSFKLKPVQDALRCLKKHKNYQSAERLIKGKFPDCVNNSTINVWCIVAALVVLSETTWDVYDILRHLVSGQCPFQDILEVLYCIATFLLYIKRQFRVGYGLHYRVYYALYAYENDWKAKVSDLSAICQNVAGQQSMLKYGCGEGRLRLTHEQMRIVNHQLLPHHIVKIVAFAGTGKTSTLVEFTKLNPNLRFLVVMYNKAVCEHAKRCFPLNVECRTSHSLAWKTQGSRFQRKLTMKIRPLDILPHLQNAPTHYGHKQRHARCVITTMENFMASCEEFITTLHVPTQVQSQDEREVHVLTDVERLSIANDAELIWKKMIDPKDFDVRTVHDCYLKLFQLDHPVLFGYDCILIDEAQDCNPAALDVLLRQSCAKVVVGDPNQQIYAFRGAVDALDAIRGTHVYYLTQSFRFGPEIAQVASLVLEVLKEKDHKTLVGGMQTSSVMGSHIGQVGVLARSNVSLFNEVVRMLFNGPRRSYDPEKVVGVFAGGVKGYRFDQLVDIYYLMQMDLSSVKDKFIKRFQNLGALQSYATNVKDVELLGKIRLVKQHTYRIPDYVKTIETQCRGDMEMANVVFSTVHKAKGLEFDTVCLMDDFTIGLFPYSPRPDPRLKDEFNVLYVAITRAKKCLCMPPVLYCLLLGAHEKFEFLVPCANGPNLKCCRCQETFQPGSLVMVRRRLHLVGCQLMPEGYLCNSCGTSLEVLPDVHYPLMVIGNTMLHDRYHEMYAFLVSTT